jgi:hypothetical protein
MSAMDEIADRLCSGSGNTEVRIDHQIEGIAANSSATVGGRSFNQRGIGQQPIANIGVGCFIAFNGALQVRRVPVIDDPN